MKGHFESRWIDDDLIANKWKDLPYYDFQKSVK